jgi:hypothetical protein
VLIMKKSRAALSLVLVIVGAALLAYGLFAHADTVWSADEPPTVATATEPDMIREVTVGGLKRGMVGELKKTYVGQAPKACPT